MNRIFRLLILAAALPLALSACSDSPKPGSTNVEMGSVKGEYAGEHQGAKNGDSLTAGLTRDTTNRPTGKQLFNAADQAKDRNHNGLSD